VYLLGLLLEALRCWLPPARRPPAVLRAGSMLDKEKILPYFIPAKDGIFDQYPETSIQNHAATSWNHGALLKAYKDD